MLVLLDSDIDVCPSSFTTITGIPVWIAGASVSLAFHVTNGIVKVFLTRPLVAKLSTLKKKKTQSYCFIGQQFKNIISKALIE